MSRRFGRHRGLSERYCKFWHGLSTWSSFKISQPSWPSSGFCQPSLSSLESGHSDQVCQVLNISDQVDNFWVFTTWYLPGLELTWGCLSTLCSWKYKYSPPLGLVNKGRAQIVIPGSNAETSVTTKEVQLVVHRNKPTSMHTPRRLLRRVYDRGVWHPL